MLSKSSKRELGFLHFITRNSLYRDLLDRNLSLHGNFILLKARRAFSCYGFQLQSECIIFQSCNFQWSSCPSCLYFFFGLLLAKYRRIKENWEQLGFSQMFLELRNTRIRRLYHFHYTYRPNATYYLWVMTWM